MNKDVTITARIDETLGDQLARLAMATGRSKSWVISEALRQYVAAEMQFVAAVEEGLQALQQGQVVAHADVADEFQRRFRRQ